MYEWSHEYFKTKVKRLYYKVHINNFVFVKLNFFEFLVNI